MSFCQRTPLIVFILLISSMIFAPASFANKENKPPSLKDNRQFIVMSYNPIAISKNAKIIYSSDYRELSGANKDYHRNMTKKIDSVYNSECAPSIFTRIKVIRDLYESNFSSYKLANGETWEEFSLNKYRPVVAGTNKVESSTHLFRRPDRQPVLIFQEKGFCKMRFLKSNREVFVFKH